MMLSAAIVLDHGKHHRVPFGQFVHLLPEDRDSLTKLINGLVAAGFEQFLFLLTGEGDKEYDARLTLQLQTVLPSLSIVRRIHPDFIAEVAIHEATGDWVFIFFNGESVHASGPPSFLSDPPDLKDFLVKCTHGVVQLQTTAGLEPGLEPRGFRRRGKVTTEGPYTWDELHVDTTARKLPVGANVDPVRESTLDLTVILPTWRLGGLDLTLGCLAEQTLAKDRFEVIVVDALYPWRKNVFVGRGSWSWPGPFDNVRHWPVDNSIFPISSHGRFRNTAIRRARGRRLVFMCEYSMPPPGFLAAHVGLDPLIIGTSRWIRLPMPEGALAIHSDPTFKSCMTVWDVIRWATVGTYNWSTFQRSWQAVRELALREPLSNRPTYPKDLVTHETLGTLEYVSHWKAESADTALVRKINGWDETFDGSGDFADVEFSTRLLWAGARHQLVEPPVPVLDAHEISVAPLEDITRSNGHRLEEVRQRRCMRCVHGAVAGIRDREIRHINEEI